MKPLLFLGALLFAITASLAAGRPEPGVQVDTFFQDLGEKGSVAAIKELCEETLLEARSGNKMETSVFQLDTALKQYGKISRTETVEKKVFGESFMRLRFISYHASGAPLFWEFMFFRPKGEWQIFTYRFDAQFYRAFSETP